MRIVFLLFLSVGAMAQSVKIPTLGICIDMEKDSIASRAGYTAIVESIAKCISPRVVSDEQFTRQLEIIKSLPVPIYAVNIFMPGDLKLVGPDVNEDAIMAYAEVVLQRCQQAGINIIIWGSGGARRVPDGYDRTKAKAQFVSIAKKVANLANAYAITIALENLNSTETNFINKLSDALDIAREVDESNFRVCADIYHMLMENEPAAVIEKGKGLIMHVDIAENKTRTPPGVNGENFVPYLRALKKIQYGGVIVLECKWADQAAQAKPAFDYLTKQLQAAYAEK